MSHLVRVFRLVDRGKKPPMSCFYEEMGKTKECGHFLNPKLFYDNSHITTRKSRICNKKNCYKTSKF
ncbi:hypothetical protein AHAS_Ahas16G0183400 [Arachis hypogaea]